MNTKYLFSLLSSRMLKLQFDTKEELSSLEHNNALIEQDLEEPARNAQRYFQEQVLQQ